jgi:hypothetical protein
MWQSVCGTTLTGVTCMHEEMKNKLNPEARNFCLTVAYSTGRLKNMKLLFCLSFCVFMKLG